MCFIFMSVQSTLHLLVINIEIVRFKATRRGSNVR